MAFISYAQNLEDVMLWRALKHVQNGFYVDVGANDPVKDSVTHAFYEMGWSGINIEPDDDFIQQLNELRPRDMNLKMAVGSTNGVSKFHKIKDTGLSTLNAEVATKQQEAGWQVTEETVKIRPLDQILDLHSDGPIHFLKIDVEGFEQEVILGLDLKVWRPWIILIEATAPSSQSKNYHEWEPSILGAEYQFAYFDGLNRFYVANEHIELLPLLQIPPNIFDDYVTIREFNLQDLSQKQTQLLQSQDEQIFKLTNDYLTIQAQSEEDQKKNEKLNHQLITIRAKNDSFKAELSKSIKLNDELTDDLRNARARNDQFFIKLEQVLQELDKVYQSRSYRVTAPLRSIAAWGRSVRNLSMKEWVRSSLRSTILHLKQVRWISELAGKIKRRFPGFWSVYRTRISQKVFKNEDTSFSLLYSDRDDFLEDEKHYLDLFTSLMENDIKDQGLR